MTTFETVTEETREFGNNSYLEFAKKRLVDENGHSSDFYVVSRGFYDKDGGKRWTKFVTMPAEPELLDFICEQAAASAQAVREKQEAAKKAEEAEKAKAQPTTPVNRSIPNPFA